MLRRRTWLTLLLMVALPLRCTPSVSEACCPAFFSNARVQIANQSVLIVWDPSTQTEHFVRSARFQNTQPNSDEEEASTKLEQNFGFLVPSPTQPTIEATDPDHPFIFQPLEWQIQPRVEMVEQTVLTNGSLILSLLGLKMEDRLLSTGAIAPNAEAVQVLESKRVAGLDVAVLKANDADALTEWLSRNDYEARPELKDWVQPYIAKEWIITAFKYAATGEQTSADSVRISFRTEQPLFPYRVPTDQIVPSEKGHLLRTYLVGPGAAVGHFKDGSEQRPWTAGKLVYTQPINPAQYESLLTGAVPFDRDAPPSGMWLTAIEDRTWPSGTEDLWFTFHPDAQPYQRVQKVSRYVERMVPIDVLLLGVVAIAYAGRRWYRGRLKA